MAETIPTKKIATQLRHILKDLGEKDPDEGVRKLDSWIKSDDIEPYTDLKSYIVLRIGDRLEMCTDLEHKGVHPHVYTGAGVVTAAIRKDEVKPLSQIRD